MMKQEFEKLANISIPLDQCEYEVIETVYGFYPGIHHVKGKEQVAELYKTHGIRIFEDMLKRAETARDIEDKIIEFNRQISILKDDREGL